MIYHDCSWSIWQLSVNVSKLLQTVLQVLRSFIDPSLRWRKHWKVKRSMVSWWTWVSQTTRRISRPISTCTDVGFGSEFRIDTIEKSKCLFFCLAFCGLTDAKHASPCLGFQCYTKSIYRYMCHVLGRSRLKRSKIPWASLTTRPWTCVAWRSWKSVMWIGDEIRNRPQVWTPPTACQQQIGCREFPLRNLASNFCQAFPLIEIVEVRGVGLGHLQLRAGANVCRSHQFKSSKSWKEFVDVRYVMFASCLVLCQTPGGSLDCRPYRWACAPAPAPKRAIQQHQRVSWGSWKLDPSGSHGCWDFPNTWTFLSPVPEDPKKWD